MDEFQTTFNWHSDYYDVLYATDTVQRDDLVSHMMMQQQNQCCDEEKFDTNKRTMYMLNRINANGGGEYSISSEKSMAASSYMQNCLSEADSLQNGLKRIKTETGAKIRENRAGQQHSTEETACIKSEQEELYQKGATSSDELNLKDDEKASSKERRR